MSEQQTQDINEIIIRAQVLIDQTKKAKDSLKTWIKILIGSVLVAVSVVSVLSYNVKKNSEKIEFLGADYAPLWVLQDLQKNNDYMILEVAATFGADKKDTEELKEIQKKYTEFQIDVVNRIARTRGGMATIIRSFEPPKNN